MKRIATAAVLLSLLGACTGSMKSISGAGDGAAASASPAPGCTKAKPLLLDGTCVECLESSQCEAPLVCRDHACVNPDQPGRLQGSAVTGPGAAQQDPIQGKELCDLKEVHFAFNQAEPDAESMADLEGDVGCLSRRGLTVVRVEAHCDVRGSNAWNDLLSTRRAEYLRTYLAAHGVDAKGIQIVGFGKARPLVVDATTEEEHRQNRRGVVVTKVRAPR